MMSPEDGGNGKPQAQQETNSGPHEESPSLQADARSKGQEHGRQAEEPAASERDRVFEERLLGAKDATLRLWERNRHVQERVNMVEHRLKRVTWLARVLLVVSVGTAAVLVVRQFAPEPPALTALQERIAALQKQLDGFQASASLQNGARTQAEATGEQRNEHVAAAVLALVKQQAPELFAAAFGNAVHINAAGHVGIGTQRPQAPFHVVGDLLGAAQGADDKALRIAVGETDPRTTDWKQYNKGGVYVDVDTSGAEFSSTPYYFTSLGGHTNNWLAQGITSIYEPTAQGFRVHVGYPGLTAAQAKAWGWHINWLAVGD